MNIRCYLTVSYGAGVKVVPEGTSFHVCQLGFAKVSSVVSSMIGVVVTTVRHQAHASNFSHVKICIRTKD